MANGEKPYEFVPFPDKPPQVEEVQGQSAYVDGRLTGWLELELETLTPVQVASGYMDFVRAGGQEYLASLQAHIRRRTAEGEKRVYVLPGSSLKGAIRSLVEALSPSCLRVASRTTRLASDRRFNPCQPPRLCPACRLFGAQDYQAQLIFEDALVPSGSLVIFATPLLWTPARGSGRLPPIYLDPRGQIKGRKFYYHYEPATGSDVRALVKRGVRIPARIHFHNLTEGELGLLLSALGLNPQKPFPIKVGAGKPVGLGTVQVHPTSLGLHQGAQGIRQAGRLGKTTTDPLTGEALQQCIAQLCSRAAEEGLLLPKQLQALAEIYDRIGLQEKAPEGTY